MLSIAKRYSDHPDGFDELYRVALEKAQSIPWGIPFVEIGTREGGSALLFLEAIRASKIPRPLITVDPYGLAYISGPDHYQPIGEERYRQAMKMLSEFSHQHRLTHIHQRMTSEAFMKMWPEIGLWIEGEQINKRPFGLVYLDGEHTEDAVNLELDWLLPQMIPGGLIIIDDIECITNPNGNHAVLTRVFKEGKKHGNRLYLEIPGESHQQEQRAVVTIAVGDTYRQMARLTHPSLKAYAEKIGADFIVINESHRTSPHWEKFQLYNLFERYERILYLDTDLLVRDDTPDIFELIPPQKLGMFNEAPWTDGRHQSMVDACRDYGFFVPDWDGRYFNTGVIVASHCHRYLFKKPEKEIFNFYEQGYLNAVIGHGRIPVQELTYHFNRMCCMDPYTGEDRFASYIMHYAGFPNISMVLEVIQQDIREWKSRAGILPASKRYFYPRHILIDVQGGLGDQVQAEPAIRFARDYVWPGADIQIKSHFPRLFEHLGLPLHEAWWSPPSGIPFYQSVTLPGTNTLHWQLVSNLLCHTIDFASMAVLRRTLPVENKQIRLQVLDEDKEEVRQALEGANIVEYLLVHPGKHFESKTFPRSWWQEVVNILAAEIPICLFGQDDPDGTRGVWDVECPPGAMDTRNRLSLGGNMALISQAWGVLSNDSAPIHLAGAFDNWIYLLPSCKHPEHLLPWRNGKQDYKAKAFYKRLVIDDCACAPTEVHGASAEFIYRDWSEYLPEPEEIVKAICNTANEKLCVSVMEYSR